LWGHTLLWILSHPLARPHPQPPSPQSTVLCWCLPPASCGCLVWSGPGHFASIPFACRPCQPHPPSSQGTISCTDLLAAVVLWLHPVLDFTPRHTDCSVQWLSRLADQNALSFWLNSLFSKNWSWWGMLHFPLVPVFLLEEL
jgi:hypothetical protein